MTGALSSLYLAMKGRCQRNLNDEIGIGLTNIFAQLFMEFIEIVR